MSAFTDAITQSMVASLDPMNGITRDFAAQQLKVSQLSLARDKLSLMQDIQVQIHNAKALGDNADVTSVTQLQKMLDDIRTL